MGLFCSVIHVRNADAESVCTALIKVTPNWPFKLSEQRAISGPPRDYPNDSLLYIVSPVLGSWTTILEAHGYIEDGPQISDLAKALSASLSTCTLALTVHDDDILFYNLCRNGESLDDYNSNPQYFENERLSDDVINEQRHDPHPFGKLLPDGVSLDQLQALLDRGWWSAYQQRTPG